MVSPELPELLSPELPELRMVSPELRNSDLFLAHLERVPVYVDNPSNY